MALLLKRYLRHIYPYCMKLAFSYFLMGFVCIASLTAQKTSPYPVGSFPATFNYLSDDFTVQADGPTSFTVAAKSGEEYYVNLFKASSRFNADSLRYMFTKLYQQDPAVENIQVNEVGPGKAGNLDAEKVRITFVAGGGYYTATCVLVRFHLNRKYNAFMLYYEMADMNQNNATRFNAVKQGFEDLCASFVYTDFKYKKHVDNEDSITIEYPDFWYAGKNDTALLVDDGRCKILIKSYVAKDSTSTETYAKCQRDYMKKNSALYPAFKGNLVKEIWRNNEMCTKFSGSYQYEEFGIRKDRYFVKHIIRRNVAGTMKDFHVLFECPELYRESYYSPKYEIMLKSIILPGLAVDLKK